MTGTVLFAVDPPLLALTPKPLGGHSTVKTYTIPVIGGDGIGPEVIAEGKKVLNAAAEAHGFRIEWA